MSLINDALKQAKQSQPPNPPSPPPSLAPVESASQGGGSWLAPVMILLLLVAAGIFIGLSLFKHGSPAAGTPPVAATVTQQVKTAMAILPVVTNPPPAAVVPPKPPGPKLQGILYTVIRPCAIISGKTVFVGDSVGKLRVVAISKHSVTLQNETETNVLSLSPQ